MKLTHQILFLTIISTIKPTRTPRFQRNKASYATKGIQHNYSAQRSAEFWAKKPVKGPLSRGIFSLAPNLCNGQSCSKCSKYITRQYEFKTSGKLPYVRSHGSLLYFHDEVKTYFYIFTKKNIRLY